MKYILTVIAFLITSSSFAQSKISTEVAYKNLNDKKNKIQLLDVRTTKEFDSKHLKNAIHADWTRQDHYTENSKNLDKKTPVYVYCLSGGRSAKAAKQLADQGFDVYEIDGGIMKWEADNLPLEQKTERLEGLSKQQFEELTKRNPIVLIDFHAEWCGPCKLMSPKIDAIQKKYSHVKVVKIDVDQNPDLTKSLGITSIPYFTIYKNGTLTWSKKGAVDQKTIEAQL